MDRAEESSWVDSDTTMTCPEHPFDSSYRLTERMAPPGHVIPTRDDKRGKDVSPALLLAVTSRRDDVRAGRPHHNRAASGFACSSAGTGSLFLCHSDRASPGSERRNLWGEADTRRLAQRSLDSLPAPPNGSAGTSRSLGMTKGERTSRLHSSWLSRRDETMCGRDARTTTGRHPASLAAPLGQVDAAPTGKPTYPALRLLGFAVTGLAAPQPGGIRLRLQLRRDR